MEAKISEKCQLFSLSNFFLYFKAEEVLYFENFDTTTIFTPVRAEQLDILLKETCYNKRKRRKLVQGFKEGFDLGYDNKGKKQQITSRNLKFTIGDETELWNKVMKEVKEKRYAGPFKDLPYKHDYIQSPIGLVPKDGGKKTRLIFHLSHPRPRKQKKSIPKGKHMKNKFSKHLNSNKNTVNACIPVE